MGLADMYRLKRGLPLSDAELAEHPADEPAYPVPVGAEGQTFPSVHDQSSFVRVLGNLLSNFGRKGMNSGPEPQQSDDCATQPNPVRSRGWLGIGLGRKDAKLAAVVSAAVHDVPSRAWIDDAPAEHSGGAASDPSASTLPVPGSAASSAYEAAYKAAYKAAFDRAEVEGRAKVHARMLAIRNDPRCKGHEATAFDLAIASPDLSPEAVCAFVEKHGPTASGPGEAGLVFGRLPPLPGHEAQASGGYVNIDRFWGESVERTNRELHL